MRGLFTVSTVLCAVVALSAIALAQVNEPGSPSVSSDSCPAAQSNIIGTVTVHEPGAGQLTDITPNPREALSLSFSPFDAQAFRHGRDLILRFADDGLIIIRGIYRSEAVLPIPVHLPDGTVMSFCELLRAMPGEPGNADSRKIPTEKIPQKKHDHGGPASL